MYVIETFKRWQLGLRRRLCKPIDIRLRGNQLLITRRESGAGHYSLFVATLPVELFKNTRRFSIQLRMGSTRVLPVTDHQQLRVDLPQVYDHKDTLIRLHQPTFTPYVSGRFPTFDSEMTLVEYKLVFFNPTLDQEITAFLGFWVPTARVSPHSHQYYWDWVTPLPSDWKTKKLHIND